MTITMPRAAEWTVEDVLAIPDEGHHELVDGVLIVSPHAGWPHQRAVARLMTILERAAPDGSVEVFPGGNVRTSAGLSIPDVVVARAAAAASAGVTMTAADLLAVIEVVSPGSRRMDRLVKPEIYAESGIGVFWRVWVEPLPRIEVFVLGAAREYEPASLLVGDERSTVRHPFPVTLAASDLVITAAG